MKKQNMKKQNMKKGITLIEIILSIVLIAIIMGITIPKLMSNSTKAEIKQVITSDLRSIVEAANTWKRASSIAEGNFQKLTSSALNSRLPSNMIVNSDLGYIYSSGLQAGTTDANSMAETGVRYTVKWQFDNTLKGTSPDFTNTGNFSIGMDFSIGESDLTWDSKMVEYAQDVFRDTIAEIGTSAPWETSTNTVDGSVTDTSTAFPCGTNAICHGNINTNAN